MLYYSVLFWRAAVDASEFSFSTAPNGTLSGPFNGDKQSPFC
jgi:hypothetical protein